MTKCIRCKKESELVGFCVKCYREVYGIKNMRRANKKISELKCKKAHLSIIERDADYTKEIKDSIQKIGLKNPIIINSDNIIMVGHHRYFIAKELGWETIPCYIIDTDINKFIEGGSNNLFVVKLDGKLIASLFQIREIIPILDQWISGTPYWRTSHLSIEAFTGIGSTNDKEKWADREERRVTRLKGKRNLSGVY